MVHQPPEDPLTGNAQSLVILDRLSVRLGSTDPEFLREMLLTYLHASDPYIEEIRRCADLGDLTSVASAAHALRSGSYYVGADDVLAHCTSLEDCVRADRKENPLQYVGLVLQSFEEYRQSAEGLIRSQFLKTRSTPVSS